MQHLAKFTHFLNMLEGWRGDRVFWYALFPVEEAMFDSAKTKGDFPLLVDVAGGHGYDLQAFMKRFPGRGPLVLQELPPVIDDIKALHPDIVTMKDEFLTAQPIKVRRASLKIHRRQYLGAKGYYFRSICHDDSDSKCRETLSNTVATMEPGYSRITINDWVLTDTGASLLPAMLDIQMMAVPSRMELAESQWQELLNSVGLRIVKIWSSGKEVEGLIEAVRNKGPNPPPIRVRTRSNLMHTRMSDKFGLIRLFGSSNAVGVVEISTLCNAFPVTCGAEAANIDPDWPLNTHGGVFGLSNPRVAYQRADAVSTDMCFALRCFYLTFIAGPAVLDASKPSGKRRTPRKVFFRHQTLLISTSPNPSGFILPEGELRGSSKRQDARRDAVLGA